MKVKIASYNISGGFYEDDNTVDFFDKNKADNISSDFLNNIINDIKTNDIDIICFQEIITTSNINYIAKIIANTGLKNFKMFELSPCHIVENTNCGIAILSKYEIIDSIDEKFTNPMLSKTTTNGNTYYTFDKGYLKCTINVFNKNINILTHHGFPFRRFNSSANENKNVFLEFDNIIHKLNPDIVTGDFNAENFLELMPYTNLSYKKTIDEITTNDGMKFDDILLKKDVDFNRTIVKGESDHYMVIAEVEI